MIIHNDIYKIKSIFPKLPKHETFLKRDLTESEYIAFLAMFALPSENSEDAEIKAVREGELLNYQIITDTMNQKIEKIKQLYELF